MCKIMNKILKELGISEKVYGEMQELCPNINELSDNEIMNKVNILKQINCNDMQIMHQQTTNKLQHNKVLQLKTLIQEKQRQNQ